MLRMPAPEMCVCADGRAHAAEAVHVGAMRCDVPGCGRAPGGGAAHRQSVFCLVRKVGETERDQ